MDLSPIGRAALKAREGEVLTAYKDSVGILTIGVGITTASGLIKVTPGLTITAATSDALFTEAVKAYAKPVSDLGVKLEQHQFDALVSLCFNIGQPAFTRSTVAKRLRAGDVKGAAEAILMWNKPAAIISRRQGEYDQFRTPYAVALPKARSTDARPVSAPLSSLTPIGEAPLTIDPPAAGPVFAPAPRNAGAGAPAAPPLPAPTFTPAPSLGARLLSWLSRPWFG